MYLGFFLRWEKNVNTGHTAVKPRARQTMIEEVANLAVVLPRRVNGRDAHQLLGQPDQVIAAGVDFAGKTGVK